VYDLKNASGRCFFELLATFAKFELDLLQLRTREGMAVARATASSKAKRRS